MEHSSPTKKDLVKINDYLWEIPKSFRPDMRVPARIYASEKMLGELFKDRSLWQLVNLTTLPGVHKYAFVMPDVHEGYGSPVGGVVAIKQEEGIVSPGMCLEENSQVLHPLGYTLEIGKFQNIQAADISCLDFGNGAVTRTPVLKFFKLKANPHIYKAITNTGRVIEATDDHPFYTPTGMKLLKELKTGDKVALYPFEGVPYSDPAEKILADERIIKSYWERLGQDPAGHGASQVVNRLKARLLLPLKTNSPQIGVLLKIMGYLLGDGTMYFKGKREGGRIAFYGKEDALQEIKKDLALLGFNARLFRRQRHHRIRTTYKEYEFQREEVSLVITSTSLAILLWALGMPVGNKAKQGFEVPLWIFDLPLWQKRLFLAGFFGAELSSPDTYKEHGFNFYAPVLGVNKAEDFLPSGKKLLGQISKLLEEFGVRSKKISSRREQKNKDGSISYRARLILASDPQNLIRLWGSIGYEYHREKQWRANLAVHYIRLKQQFIKEKALKNGIKARSGLKTYTAKNIAALQELIKAGGRGLARPSRGSFSTFTEFVEEVSVTLGESGMVWDRIQNIEKIPFRGFVYDVTVAHQDHNFIANNFVVSNCGYDINCGVRLLRTRAKYQEIKDKIPELMDQIYREVPSGVGQGGWLKLSPREMDQMLAKGARWVIERGHGSKADLEFCESNGVLAGAEPELVSDHAKKRARDQLGTIGAGNHFVEVERVDRVFSAEGGSASGGDESTAKALGLFKDEITILIHCGSRGLGHQVATDYIKLMMQVMSKYKITLADRELASAPFNSPEGQKYFAAMKAAANFAWANRQLIMQEVREAWRSVFGNTYGEPELIYDVAHNIVKLEEYDGQKVLVHRKGATRAFPPGHSEIPAAYQSCGQPVFIPGSMGTASFVLTGVAQTMQEAFGSSCHGAGRVMSRTRAKQVVHGDTLKDELEKQGIFVRAGSLAGLAEEAPLAYKDVEEVVDVVHNAGIAKKVARLKPVGVIKG